SSKVRTTSPGARKSRLPCGSPNHGPPVVSTSAVRETPREFAGHASSALSSEVPARVAPATQRQIASVILMISPKRRARSLAGHHPHRPSPMILQKSTIWPAARPARCRCATTWGSPEALRRHFWTTRSVPAGVGNSRTDVPALRLATAVVRSLRLVEIGIGGAQRRHGPHLGPPVASRLGFCQHLEPRGIAARADGLCGAGGCRRR